MNRAERRASKSGPNLAKSQGNAQLIFTILQGEKTPRDAAATLAATHAALIWTQEQDDEDKARQMMQEMVEGVVELWKANRKFYEEQKAKALQ